MKVTTKFAHNPNDTPGSLVFEGTEDEIKEEARRFVKDGFRDWTWISVDFKDHTYVARNVRGAVIARNTKT